MNYYFSGVPDDQIRHRVGDGGSAASQRGGTAVCGRQVLHYAGDLTDAATHSQTAPI